MINYEWTDLLSVDEPTQVADQARQILDHYDQTMADNYLSQPTSFSFQQQQQNQPQVHSLYDSGAFSLSYSNHMSPEIVTGATNGCMLIPKSENSGSGSMTNVDHPARIGLNLGGRTYFSSSDDDIVNRLYRRSRLIDSGPSNSPRCQAEGCNADLTHAKHYHRRHKVCEFHSKASTVIAGGMTQRFCQQCSRFHLLSEFDQGKRSCRKRLADHNRRRRKSQPIQSPPQQQSHHESTLSFPSETITRSSSELSVVHSTAVTVAASPASMFSNVENFRSFERS